MRSKITRKVKGNVRSTCKIACKCKLDSFISEDQLEPLGVGSSVNSHHLKTAMAALGGDTSGPRTAMFFCNSFVQDCGKY